MHGMSIRFVLSADVENDILLSNEWNTYPQSIDKPIKHNPGKDQNKVAGAMQRGG
jgi:hypothetical protein